ncbi:MAG TPA: TIGR02679 family protein [Acetobacteraceae bacterium]|nr:TIGR02679 family protein [Acetobacteraceae bacterium]
MSGPADARLERLLGGERLGALRRRLRRRFAQAHPDRPPDQIRIDGLSAEEHAALASLLGRPQRLSASMRIDVGQVDASFRNAGLAVSLRDALERLDGPIADAAAARLQLRDQWARAVESCRDPILSELLGDPAGLGLLRRLARQDAVRGADLCRRAEAVLRRLPAPGITRSQLAAEVLGDAHALDAGRPVATLVLAVRRLAVRANEEADADPRRAGERTRELWAAAGVLVNELARPALLLNLPVQGADGGVDGEPRYASLRRLLRTPPRWDVSGRDVQVCENPNLVAIAADRLGARCAPLVCTDGMPAAAQRVLLSQLAQTGARLRYHGDFDWPGVRIANQVIRDHGGVPWRFGAEDYQAAIRNVPASVESLSGPAVAASWDGALTPAMARHRIAVAEEAVAEVLLRDLAAQ